jgi:hypothetical protein
MCAFVRASVYACVCARVCVSKVTCFCLPLKICEHKMCLKRCKQEMCSRSDIGFLFPSFSPVQMFVLPPPAPKKSAPASPPTIPLLNAEELAAADAGM